MPNFTTYCANIKADKLPKIECAIAFIIFHMKTTASKEVSLSQINKYFTDAQLVRYNTTKLRQDLAKSNFTIAGSTNDTFAFNQAQYPKVYKRFTRHIPQQTPQYIIPGMEITDRQLAWIGILVTIITFAFTGC